MVWNVLQRQHRSAGLVIILIACAAPASARARPGDHWTSIDGNTGFTGWKKELHRLVQKDAERTRNNFCIVVHGQGAELEAYVYWPERNRLITWGPSDDEISSLDQVGAPLDLEHDVVATQADIGSSTYLVTRGWVDHVISACRRYGTTFAVDKS